MPFILTSHEIFKLQTNVDYKASFDFINKHLQPFREYLLYIPSTKPVSFPIEIVFEAFERPGAGPAARPDHPGGRLYRNAVRVAGLSGDRGDGFHHTGRGGTCA